MSSSLYLSSTDALEKNLAEAQRKLCLKKGLPLPEAQDPDVQRPVFHKEAALDSQTQNDVQLREPAAPDDEETVQLTDYIDDALQETEIEITKRIMAEVAPHFEKISVTMSEQFKVLHQLQRDLLRINGKMGDLLEYMTPDDIDDDPVGCATSSQAASPRASSLTPSSKPSSAVPQPATPTSVASSVASPSTPHGNSINAMLSVMKSKSATPVSPRAPPSKETEAGFSSSGEDIARDLATVVSPADAAPPPVEIIEIDDTATDVAITTPKSQVISSADLIHGTDNLNKDVLVSLMTDLPPSTTSSSEENSNVATPASDFIMTPVTSADHDVRRLKGIPAYSTVEEGCAQVAKQKVTQLKSLCRRNNVKPENQLKASLIAALQQKVYSLVEEHGAL